MCWRGPEANYQTITIILDRETEKVVGSKENGKKMTVIVRTSSKLPEQTGLSSLDRADKRCIYGFPEARKPRMTVLLNAISRICECQDMLTLKTATAVFAKR
jgi:hypothetical protein